MLSQVEALPLRREGWVAPFPVTRPSYGRPPGRADWTRVTDDAVVNGCVACDDDAFAELVRRYQRGLFNVAYRLLGSHEDATDATQHALIQAYLALPSSRLGLPVRPWLFRILRNHCIDRLRRKEPIPFSNFRTADDDEDDNLPVDAPDSSPLPDELAERSDLERLLHAAIDTLTPRYRSVVTLRYQGELSFAEIGSCLGVPEPTARTLFQRAKGMLRKTLAGKV
jgi:RNA polymerase sigma factor (sigma-70 family)